MWPQLNEVIYSHADAVFRGGEFQSQWDTSKINSTSCVPHSPTAQTCLASRRCALGGGLYWRNDTWFARVRLLHAFAQNDIAPVTETPTPAYDDLRTEVSYTWKSIKPRDDQLSEMIFRMVGTNLLNQDISNSVSYSKDEVLMPGASVRFFARLKY